MASVNCGRCQYLRSVVLLISIFRLLSEDRKSAFLTIVISFALIGAVRSECASMRSVEPVPLGDEPVGRCKNAGGQSRQLQPLHFGSRRAIGRKPLNRSCADVVPASTDSCRWIRSIGSHSVSPHFSPGRVARRREMRARSASPRHNAVRRGKVGMWLRVVCRTSNTR